MIADVDTDEEVSPMNKIDKKGSKSNLLVP